MEEKELLRLLHEIRDTAHRTENRLDEFCSRMETIEGVIDTHSKQIEDLERRISLIEQSYERNKKN